MSNNKKFMDINELENILRDLIKYYKISKVDIGALEPFMHPNIMELLNKIEELDLRYSITTNGSMLFKYIKQIKQLKNLIKIRISFYSLNEDFFNLMSKSLHFKDVFKSIMEAKNNNLPIELNCLVLKGFENHMLDVIDFAIKNNFKLKIYNLYYMPQYKELFEKYFVSSNEILELIKSNYQNIEMDIKEYKDKRNRVFLDLENIEVVIKEDRNLKRDNKYCINCQYIDSCKEEFAEYMRVDPDFYFYPCYLRKDLRFNLKNEKILKNLKIFNEGINIRLIVSAICNFRCSFPEGKMWCLKQGGNYIWKK